MKNKNACIITLISFLFISFSNVWYIESEIKDLVNKYKKTEIELLNPSPFDPCHKTLWTGKKVKLIATGMGRLRLYPLRPAFELKELENEEKFELEYTALKMATVFEKLFGSGDNLRFIPLGQEAGQQGTEIYIELIPSAEREEGVVDILNKMKATAYATRKGLQYPGLSDEEVQKIAQLAPSILSGRYVSRSKPNNLVSRKYVNGLESIQFLASLIDYDLSFGKDFVIPAAKEEDTTSKKVACPFCDLEVIKKQLIYEGAYNWILSNNRPYMRAHLMTITKSNKDNGDLFSEEEILEKYQLWEKIHSIYREKFGIDSMVILTRSGLGAGQTVPHNHEHVLGIDSNEIPFWALNALLEISGSKTRVGMLESYEMARMRKELEPCFQN